MTAPCATTLELHLTDRDIRLLEDLEQYRLLTTRQIQRLHLPATPFGTHASVSSATRGTTRILTRLEAIKAIARLQRRIGGIKHGSAQTIWHLGSAGERLLRARHGSTTRKRYNEPGLTFTRHTLAVADLAITLREHAAAHHFDLLDLETEPACWRPFTGIGGEALTLKPDLFTVTADPATETHSFIEVDLDTEHLPAILRKCHLYQQYQRTGSEQQQRGLFPAVIWLVQTPARHKALYEAIAADPTLDRDLFWIALTEHALTPLAPYTYAGEHSINAKGGTSMNSSTITAATAPADDTPRRQGDPRRPLDQTDRAKTTITTWLALNPGTQDVLLARLIAATLHGGPGTALERFAATGALDAEAALAELNNIVVPIEREPWLDALGRYIISSGGRS